MLSRYCAAVIGSSLIVLGACGGSGAGDSGADAGPSLGDAANSDGDANDRACNALPPHQPSWLRPVQEDIVARLSGEVPVSSGLVLTERASASARATTRTFLSDYFAGLGLVPKLDNYGTGINVYAELGATTGTDEYVVVGAHFDSVVGSPGANDNATGVAAVLALARYLSTINCRAVNVIFVLFDEEEVGLVGSQNFASLLATGGINVQSVHTIDQMGWDGDGDRALELERPDTGLYATYTTAKAAGGFSMPLHETATGSTDHVSFRAQGFDAIGLTEEFVNGDTTPHYHESTDSYATVNFAYLQSTTELLFYRFGTQLVTTATLNAPVARAAWDGPAVFRMRKPVAAVPGWHGCRNVRRVPTVEPE